MSLLQLNLDYSDRDFESLRLRLQGLIQSVYPYWTDFNVANFGNILLEMMAYVGDTLHYYQDSQAMETFWPTLTQRISAIRLGRLIGYSLRGASAATVDLTFTIPQSYTSNLIIPVGTVVKTTDPEEPLSFRTTVAGTITAGSTEVTVAAEQAEVRTETRESSDEPNQELVLVHTPFLDGSLDSVTGSYPTITAGISAANGDYTRVDSFLGQKATARVFTTVVDHFERVHVRFGNGVNGEIPQGEINIGYKVGGGLSGNVEANRVTVLEDQLFFVDGTPAVVTVTNDLAASGGADRMTLSEAKAEAPASLRTLTRTVTREDFETTAESVAGVARALMATANEYAGITENFGRVYVVAQGSKLASGRIAPATPSSGILSQIDSAIRNDKPQTITFDYEVLAAPFLPITVAARIYLKTGYDGTQVAANIRAALADFFAAQLATGVANPNIDFGANLKDANNTIVGEIVWSDVFNAVCDVTGVRKVDEGSQGFLLNSKRESVVLTPIEFPTLSTITLTDADTGSVL